MSACLSSCDVNTACEFWCPFTRDFHITVYMVVFGALADHAQISLLLFCYCLSIICNSSTKNDYLSSTQSLRGTYYIGKWAEYVIFFLLIINFQNYRLVP